MKAGTPTRVGERGPKVDGRERIIGSARYVDEIGRASCRERVS
jgi:hypothetical protein